MRRLYDEAAAAALESRDLVPPPRPASFPDGDAAALRDAMARFSSGDDHRHRRADVEVAIASLDTDLLVREVIERTEAIVLSDDPVEAIADIGLVVPTMALLATLGVDTGAARELADQVRILVATLGRGALVSPNTEAAARRLRDEFAAHPAGSVATISMLYQNHDATAALFASTLLARATGEPREHALARTVRRANVAVTLIDERIEEGEVVEVSLDGHGAEFGLGDHACPGQAIAVQIVDAMVGTLERLDADVDVDEIAVGPDGRATSLPLSS